MKERKPSKALANASFVLGILSLFCGFFLGLPAVILGHVALRRARKTPELFTGRSEARFGLVVGYVTSAISLSVLVVAFDKATQNSYAIRCLNNMKQIEIALQHWASTNDSFPFNASKRVGGTEEFCDRDANGFDKNASRHFQILSNELGSPKVLVCPSDSSRRVALDFQSLGAANVSYQLRTGTNIDETNPKEVLIRCPIHGHVGLCDGSVHYREEFR